jgi:hypothetical protein
VNFSFSSLLTDLKNDASLYVRRDDILELGGKSFLERPTLVVDGPGGCRTTSYEGWVGFR